MRETTSLKDLKKIIVKILELISELIQGSTHLKHKDQVL